MHGHLLQLLGLNGRSDPLNRYRVVDGQIDLSVHPERGVTVSVREV